MRKYCPSCKTHTEHKVSSTKKKSKSALSRGSKSRLKKRGLGVGFGNRGKIARGAISSWKRVGAKLAKRTDLRYECTTCKKQWCQRWGIKTKRLEFI